MCGVWFDYLGSCGHSRVAVEVFWFWFGRICRFPVYPSSVIRLHLHLTRAPLSWVRASQSPIQSARLILYTASFQSIAEVKESTYMILNIEHTLVFFSQTVVGIRSLAKISAISSAALTVLYVAYSS